MLVSSTTAFNTSMGAGGEGGKFYPFVVAIHPEWMKLGMGLIVLGFIIQTMEGQSLKSKLVNVGIFLVTYLGIPLILGAR